MGHQLGAAVVAVVTMYPPHFIHPVAREPAGHGPDGSDGEPNQTIDPVVASVSAIGPQGATTRTSGVSSQARMGAMRVTIDEPVQRRPVMPVALMGGPDEPEQEHSTDSAQRAVGGVGPGAIGNMSANLTAGAASTGTLLNATPPPLPSAPDDPEPEYPTDSTSQTSAVATGIAFAGRVRAGALTPTMPAVPQQPRIFPGVPEPTLVIHWAPHAPLDPFKKA
jgi:hypothetical protein